MILKDLSLSQKAIISELIHRAEANYSVAITVQSDVKTINGLENRNIIVVLARRRLSPLLDYSIFEIEFTAAAAARFGLKHKPIESGEPAAEPAAEPIVVAFETVHFYVDIRSDSLIAVYRNDYPNHLPNDVIEMIGKTLEANVYLVNKPKKGWSKRRDEVWRCIEDAIVNAGLPVMHLRDLQSKTKNRKSAKEKRAGESMKNMFPE